MTNFSTSFFGKDIHDLTYQDIEDYFTVEHVESNNIEYKSYSSAEGNLDKQLNKVIRAIAAFLNSEGGIVVWGSPKGVVEGKEKKFIGELSPVTEYKDKDWIINKVSDNITPLPIGIEVSILKKGENEIVYIFEVQQSQTQPHQHDNTYCVRLDGQTKPAPHYLVEALFRKISYPRIEAYIGFTEFDFLRDRSGYFLRFSIGIFNFSPLQNEENLIYRITTNTGVFNHLEGTSNSRTHKDEIKLIHYGTPNVNQLFIKLTKEELTKKEMKIMVSFGGKMSPAKYCEYTLGLKNIFWSKPMLHDISIEKKENISFVDRASELGSSDEQAVSAFIKAAENLR